MKNRFIIYFFFSSFFYMHVSAHSGLSNSPELGPFQPFPSAIMERLGYYLINSSDFKSFYRFITASAGIKNQFKEDVWKFIDQQVTQQRQENSLKMKNFLATSNDYACIIQPDDLVQCVNLDTKATHIPLDLGPVVSIVRQSDIFCAITKEDHAAKCWKNDASALDWRPFVVFEKGIKLIIMNQSRFYFVQEDDTILSWSFINEINASVFQQSPQILKMGPIKTMRVIDYNICVMDPIENFVRCLNIENNHEPSVIVTGPPIDVGAIIAFDENVERTGGLTCAIKKENEQVYCWEHWGRGWQRNHHWLLDKNSPPQRVPFDMEPIQKVARGDLGNIYAIRKKDHLLQYWNAKRPQVPPHVFNDLGPVIDVAIGPFHFCVIQKKDNQVCCIKNNDGLHDPYDVVIAPFGNKPVHAIQAQGSSSAALCAILQQDNTVECCFVESYGSYNFISMVVHPPIERKFPSTVEEWMASFDAFLSLK